MKSFYLALLSAVVCAGVVLNCTPAMVKAVQPYSISPEFDLSRTWRIAVLPPAGGSSDTGDEGGLREFAELQLLKIPTVVVVDRSKVDAVLNEQEFSWSGVVDPQTAARLGGLMGANALMSIRIGKVKHDPFFSDSPNQRDAEVSVRIVSVENGSVLYSAQGQSSSFEGAEEALKGAVLTALLPLLEKGGVK
ncbi:MAG: CsgG/HfaB family protein [candidate division WOR-3 bacterium]